MQCVAIDAAEDRIVAGDVSGRINMWNGFGPAVAAAATAASDDKDAADMAAPSGQQPGQKRKNRDAKDAGLAKETLHWHSSAVRSLVFSQDGAYLFSGGAEAVLVRIAPPLLLEADCSTADCSAHMPHISVCFGKDFWSIFWMRQYCGYQQGRGVEAMSLSYR